MKKAPQLFATATLLVICTLVSRGQTPIPVVSDTTQRTRFHAVIVNENAYDASVRTRVETAIVQSATATTPAPTPANQAEMELGRFLLAE